MTKKMLIDAAHLEEMRVVIVDGTKLEELDIETSTKKQIKANIYLAKVARVEPSLQAAFVDYGGNRHGFLAFNEIHPDYYQIPVADREALKQEIQEDKDDDSSEADNRQKRREKHKAKALDSQEASVQEEGEEDAQAEDEIETVSENENDEIIERKKTRHFKDYKIQEVIHRGQVLLVQVTKEERGNKGAALTTYLSLAGRYCVLMPNNSRGGGVSRKITNAVDRKRLKEIITKLPLPTGMSVIVRTAGKERTSLEIKRDYEYLIKTWVQIRDKTMQSSAPMLIHEEGNLIKRALRDMYTRDISEVLIEGDAEYRMAKDFMKILTPSHAKKIKQYKDESIPLFFRYQVEAQLESMHSNIVQLKSGAYLVMDQTEALVAIDVNSGRATKEKNIEETALKTNLEAATEIARQLRLRDMAGLVVIDFIDMEEARNNHAVERRMKEALRKDRARIQMGKITGFGLMELSRQRLHSSFIETSYSQCPHCKGKGFVRSTPSACIHTLHILEEESLKRNYSELHMTVCPETALYVLNNKRHDLHKIEMAYDVKIFINADDSLVFPTDYRMERVVRVLSEATALEIEEEVEVVVEKEEVVEKPVQEKKGKQRPPRRKKNSKKPQFVEKTEAEEQSDSFENQAVAIEEEEVIQADVLFEEGLQSASVEKKESKENSDDVEKKNLEQKQRDPRKRRGHFLRRDRHFRFPRKDKAKGEGNDNAPALNEEKKVQSSEATPMLAAPEPQALLEAPEKAPLLPAPKRKKAISAPKEKKALAAPKEKKALTAPKEKRTRRKKSVNKSEAVETVQQSAE